MRFLPGLVALLLTVLLAACSPRTGTAVTATTSPEPNLTPAPAPQKFAPTPSDTALLWRITGNGLAQESFLFGTIHLIPAEDYFLPSGMVAALNDADEVVFEIDPQAMQDPSIMMRLMGQINMRGDTSLSDLMTAEDYAVVNDYFSQKGMPMFMLGRMKPMFLSAMVGQDMEALQQGMMGGGEGGMKSYELEMTQMAQKADKPISGLETIEFQLSLFDSIPYTAQAQMLLKAVEADLGKDETDGPNQMDEIVDLYKRKAIAEMGTLIKREADGVARFEELLLTKRNLNWIPAMEEKMPGGTKLFAVGAAHLGGEEGVIALLRRAGYEVEPVF